MCSDDTPYVLILHTGSNDIRNRERMENEITVWIRKVGRQCKESNVNDIISSLISRAQKRSV